MGIVSPTCVPIRPCSVHSSVSDTQLSNAYNGVCMDRIQAQERYILDYCIVSWVYHIVSVLSSAVLRKSSCSPD